MSTHRCASDHNAWQRTPECTPQPRTNSFQTHGPYERNQPFRHTQTPAHMTSWMSMIQHAEHTNTYLTCTCAHTLQAGRAHLWPRLHHSAAPRQPAAGPGQWGPRGADNHPPALLTTVQEPGPGHVAGGGPRHVLRWVGYLTFHPCFLYHKWCRWARDAHPCCGLCCWSFSLVGLRLEGCGVGSAGARLVALVWYVWVQAS